MWKRQCDHGPASSRLGTAANTDSPLILFDQFLGDPQSQAGATNSFGCKEWLEQSTACRRVYACASISHRDAQFGIAVRKQHRVAAADRELPASLHRVIRIRHQVKQDLAKFSLETKDW